MFAASVTPWCSEPDPHADSFQKVWPELWPELRNTLRWFPGEHRVSVLSWLDRSGQPFSRPSQRPARPHAGGSKPPGNLRYLWLSNVKMSFLNQPTWTLLPFCSPETYYLSLRKLFSQFHLSFCSSHILQPPLQETVPSYRHRPLELLRLIQTNPRPWWTRRRSWCLSLRIWLPSPLALPWACSSSGEWWVTHQWTLLNFLHFCLIKVE